MKEKFTKIDNTSPIQSAIKADKPEVKRSKFDLTRVKITNLTLGTIIPIDCIETIPGDTFTDLKYIIGLQARNPNVKKQLTGMRLYAHAYYNRWSDLWEGAQNFVDKGQSGKINLQIPTLRTEYKVGDADFITTTPLSLTNYLDVPATHYDTNINRIKWGNGINTSQTRTTLKQIAEKYGNETINALPYVMYQKIYLEKYAPRNLIQNNKNWVPDNQRHFILPYNSTIVSELNYTQPDNPNINTAYTESAMILNPNSVLHVPESTEPNSPVWLNALHYRQKKGDYFNTALPFSNLIRGDTPIINLAGLNWEDIMTNNIPTSISASDNFAIFGTNEGIYASKPHPGATSAQNKGNVRTGARDAAGTGATDNWYAQNNSTQNVIMGANAEANPTLLNILKKVKVQSTIDAFTIANLEILSAIKIREGLTNGRYNEQVKALFGYSPKAPTTDAIYIGGAYLDIGQNEIVQTSESNTSPQGTLVGRLEAQGLLDCGNFHCDDYGYIMVVLSIVPDTYYKQGLDKWITKKIQEEVYNPLTNEMAPQAIKNKEIYWSGDPTIDEDLFGWTERNTEYKQRRNTVNGLCAIDDLDDSRYLSTQSFASTPTLSNSFVSLSPQNIDMNIFTTSNEPPFVAVIGEMVKAVRPLPFNSIPKALKEN